MISIVVPVYNSQSYLKDCLDSILSQDFEDFEIICVNDGSIDSSLSILNEYKILHETKVKIINQKNGGRSVARNSGLDNCTGDYVMFVDADDILPRGVLSQFNRIITSHPSVEAVVGAIQVLYEAHPEFKESDKTYYSICYSGCTEITDNVIDNFHYSTCGILFSRNVIKRKHLRFPVGLNYEDAYWHWCYFSQISKAYFVKEAMYTYIRHPSSIMSETFDNKEGLAVQHLFIAEAIFDFWRKNSQLQLHLGVIPKILEGCFWFAYKFSASFERTLVIYHCSRILRKFSIQAEVNTVLYRISVGDIAFLFDPNGSNQTGEYVRWLKIKALLDRLLPPFSLRRRVLLFFARRAFNIIKRLSAH